MSWAISRKYCAARATAASVDRLTRASVRCSPSQAGSFLRLSAIAKRWRQEKGAGQGEAVRWGPGTGERRWGGEGAPEVHLSLESEQFPPTPPPPPPSISPGQQRRTRVRSSLLTFPRPPSLLPPLAASPPHAGARTRAAVGASSRCARSIRIIDNIAAPHERRCPCRLEPPPPPLPPIALPRASPSNFGHTPSQVQTALAYDTCRQAPYLLTIW